MSETNTTGRAEARADFEGPGATMKNKHVTVPDRLQLLSFKKLRLLFVWLLWCRLGSARSSHALCFRRTRDLSGCSGTTRTSDGWVGLGTSRSSGRILSRNSEVHGNRARSYIHFVFTKDIVQPKNKAVHRCVSVPTWNVYKISLINISRSKITYTKSWST